MKHFLQQSLLKFVELIVILNHYQITSQEAPEGLLSSRQLMFWFWCLGSLRDDFPVDDWKKPSPESRMWTHAVSQKNCPPFAIMLLFDFLPAFAAHLESGVEDVYCLLSE